MTKGNIVTDEEFDSISVFAFYQQSSNGAGRDYRLYILIGMNSVVFGASVSSREETHSIDL